MKYLILTLMLLSFSYSQTYTFLVKEYDKEIELESKIITKIAESSINKEIILFIPEITEIEKSIYSKIFKIGKNCKEANFIFVKKNIDKNLCKNKNKLYFTNNYKRLLSNKKYFGAFFWSKSRPNIVFVKNRLAKQNISLPNSYKQFIEDL
jgi:hypothetical protein